MPTSNKTIWAAFCCSILAVCTGVSVKAQSTYSYVSPPLNTFENTACLPTCAISGSLTLAAPLPPNLVGDIGGSGDIFPSSFSFTDGLSTWTNLNSGTYGFSFDTNNLGNITNFDVYADSSFGGIYAFYDGPENDTQIGSNTNTYGASLEGTGLPGGTWMLDTPPMTTPEPSTLSLFGSGLLGLFVIARFRVAKG